MILKLFKLPITIVCLAITYFLLFNFYVEANWVHISPEVENRTSLNFVNLIYGFNVETSPLDFTKDKKK
jgi:hypothetical protein